MSLTEVHCLIGAVKDVINRTLSFRIGSYTDTRCDPDNDTLIIDDGILNLIMDLLKYLICLINTRISEYEQELLSAVSDSLSILLFGIFRIFLCNCLEGFGNRLCRFLNFYSHFKGYVYNLISFLFF